MQSTKYQATCKGAGEEKQTLVWAIEAKLKSSLFFETIQPILQPVAAKDLPAEPTLKVNWANSGDKVAILGNPSFLLKYKCS